MTTVTTAFHHPVPRDAAVYVAGHSGLVGSAIWRHLAGAGFTGLAGRRSKELDLRDREAAGVLRRGTPGVRDRRRREGRRDLREQRLPGRLPLRQPPDPDQPAGRRARVRRGAVPVPRVELHLPEARLADLRGRPAHRPLEPTNDAYAIAKITGVMQVQALRRQYGHAYISAMPTNLYGPGDNFEVPGAHVLPMVMRRMQRPASRATPSSRSTAPARHAASSCTPTTSPPPASCCWSATTTRRRSTSAGAPT